MQRESAGTGGCWALAGDAVALPGRCQPGVWLCPPCRGRVGQRGRALGYRQRQHKPSLQLATSWYLGSVTGAGGCSCPQCQAPICFLLLVFVPEIRVMRERKEGMKPPLLLSAGKTPVRLKS